LSGAPAGKGLAVTGGFDSEKLDLVIAAGDRAASGHVKPQGTGLAGYEKKKDLKSGERENGARFHVKLNDRDDTILMEGVIAAYCFRIETFSYHSRCTKCGLT